MTIARSASTTEPGRILAALLSAAVAVVYAVIAFAPPDGFESPPTPVMALASVVYLGGAVAILRVGPRLLMVGAVLNAIVLLLFVASAVGGTATVDALSLGGKAAQVALSLVLVWVARRRR